MHRQFVLLISLLAALTVAARGEQLSAGQDEHLYQMIMSLTGRGGTAPITAAVPLGGKCGTPELLYVSDYVPQASVRTKLAWTSLLAHRYNAETPDTIGSPSGHFLIHYASTGPHAVRDADVDTDPADGIPDYINRTTEIFDSVWTTEVGNLGFKAPPSDGFYPAGGDSRFDVYILDLSQIGLSGAYGATYPDSTVGEFSQHKTSFMVLDNDYTDPGYDTAYAHAPFKILSVTAAHEFFHVIQFGYDAFEFDIVNDEIRAHWMEQSAVWMEEHTYDDVNDYYSYLPAFIANINSGLQTAPVIYSPEG